MNLFIEFLILLGAWILIILAAWIWIEVNISKKSRDIHKTGEYHANLREIFKKSNTRNKINRSRSYRKSIVIICGLSVVFTLTFFITKNLYETNYCFVIDKKTGTLIDYNEENMMCSSEVKIPSKIRGVEIKIIGEKAFYKNELTSVDIPNSVTVIDRYAFENNELTSVAIPNSVTTIGSYAFSDNQLTSIVIADSVTTIGSYAFRSNKLTSVDIPNSVTVIGEEAFKNNELTSVAIPNSVTTIGSYAFFDNQLTSVEIPDSVITVGKLAFRSNQLTSVTIEGDRNRFNDDWIWIGFSADLHPAAVKYEAFYFYKETGTIIGYDVKYGIDVIIPSEIDGVLVKAIGYRAFSKCQLTNVVIPDSVTTIGEIAFYDNQLTSVTIPDSVTTIRNYAFDWNELTSVTIEGDSMRFNVRWIYIGFPNKLKPESE